MRKLRGKIILAVLVLVFVFGGTVGALVYHINDAAESVKKEYNQEIDSYFSEREEKIKHDVENLTLTEIERLKSETNKYLQEKLNLNYQEELNKKSDEIVKVTNEKIKEIKEYIDQQILEGNEKGDN